MEDDIIREISKSSEKYIEALKKMRDAFQKKWADNQPSEEKSLDDYIQMAVLGTGSFGTVKLVRDKTTRNSYAVKILAKDSVVKEKQQNHVLNEKRILAAVNFPLLVKLEFSCKDNDYLYLGLPFISGGELFTYHRSVKKFSEIAARFYASQVLLAFEYLHFMDIIYRDLKPENILIDEKGYLKLTDFGFCKIVQGRTWTLCGTPEYLAPEIIQSKGYGKSVDWWSFGVLIYEFTVGKSPFYKSGASSMEMYDRIVNCQYRMPPFLSGDMKDLINNLLQVDVTRRFGNLKNGISDIKGHKWFKNVDWIKLLTREIDPPYVPKMGKDGDASNFDKYPNLVLKNSTNNKYEEMFKNF